MSQIYFVRLIVLAVIVALVVSAVASGTAPNTTRIARDNNRSVDGQPTPEDVCPSSYPSGRWGSWPLVDATGGLLTPWPGVMSVRCTYGRPGTQSEQGGSGTGATGSEAEGATTISFEVRWQYDESVSTADSFCEAVESTEFAGSADRAARVAWDGHGPGNVTYDPAAVADDSEWFSRLAEAMGEHIGPDDPAARAFAQQLLVAVEPFAVHCREPLPPTIARSASPGPGSAPAGGHLLTSAEWADVMRRCDQRDDATGRTAVEEHATLSEREYIEYLRRVEAANPGDSWKTIVAGLHYAEYGTDVDRGLPLVGTPLFDHGPETTAGAHIEIFCGGISRGYPPRWVRNSKGERIHIGHAIAGVRSDLNRDDWSQTRRDLWRWFNTDGGDSWQVGMWHAGQSAKQAPALIIGPLGSLFVDDQATLARKAELARAGPDQRLGNMAGTWLSDFYRDPANADVPLSAAMEQYFATQADQDYQTYLESRPTYMR